MSAGQNDNCYFGVILFCLQLIDAVGGVRKSVMSPDDVMLSANNYAQPADLSQLHISGKAPYLHMSLYDPPYLVQALL